MANIKYHIRYTIGHSPPFDHRHEIKEDLKTVMGDIVTIKWIHGSNLSSLVVTQEVELYRHG